MRASRQLGRGSQRFAVHVKGQDCLDELRTGVAWGFGVVVALKGGGHLEGSCNTEADGTSDALGQQWFGVPTLDPHSYDQKERLVYWFERYKQMLDSVGLCYFTGPFIDSGRRVGPPEIAELLSASVGRQYSADELLLYGRRNVNVQKVFNTLHAGFTRADDLPPQRFVEEPVRTGPHSGARIDLDEWNHMLDRYYQLHGWDPVTGWPLGKPLRCWICPTWPTGSTARRTRSLGLSLPAGTQGATEPPPKAARPRVTAPTKASATPARPP